MGEVFKKNKIMEFKEGKKVRVVRDTNHHGMEGEEISYKDVKRVDEDGFCIGKQYVWFRDCEEIETKPTLEEVKEYFKDAKEVRCLIDVSIWNYEGKIIEDGKDEFWDNDNILLYRNGQYAEIVSYKDDKPQHYTTRTVNGLDVIDLVKHWNLNFNEGNILKYLLRDKGQDIQDLEKIIDYAQRELKHLKK